jgi:deazaflavin-dependent oxidoreductase (nitroreductase family)
LYRLTLGRIGSSAGEGDGILLLTTRGRSSGRRRTIPLRYVRNEETYVVVASNRAGPVPQWCRNLAVCPEVTIQVGALRLAARARIISGEERAPLWSRIVQRNQRWVRYQTEAATELPVVVIDPLQEHG